ncbi:MAG: hypothetical protein CFK52_12635 [Chloracidobacterium sp. CP2_5A]|nr:MAG: hypothetical protein CFK52_12635 [Chloracidobacterium sp. CP2_5A]
MLTARFSRAAAPVRSLMGRWGGWLAGVGGLLSMGLGVWVHSAQPSIVKAALAAHRFYAWSLPGFLVCATLLSLSGFLSLKRAGWIPAVGAAGAGFLTTTMAVIARDGIRDLTLLAKGFDVWQQPVASNWQAVTIFLVLFVAGVGVIGWMAYVLAKAKGVARHA